MSDSKNSEQFIKLSKSEVLPRLSSGETSLVLKIWKDIDHFYSVNLSEVKDGQVIVDKLDILPHSENSYFISFNFRNMSYYSKCLIIDHNTLEIEDEVYRAERRKNVRIVMYPRFNAYLYFTFNPVQEVEESANVLSFNRAKNEEDKLLRDYQREISTSPEINGERLLDISNTGISIICSQRSYDLLKSVKPVTAVLVFNNEKVSVDGIEIVYDVDYIDMRFDSVKMKKVGLKIVENEKIKEIVKRYDDESMTLTSLDSEFQIYIETE